MKNSNNTTTVRGEFFDPVATALEQSEQTRKCSEFSDFQYIMSCTERVLNLIPSGRAWVQKIRDFGITVSVSNFFSAMNSCRRLKVIADVAERVRMHTEKTICAKSDPLAEHSELNGFAVYAADGHTHKASSHEKTIGGKKRPVTHIYTLSLRSHALAALVLSTPQAYKKKEHELSSLKRIGTKALRMNQPKGVKVLHVYDPAIIDYQQWYNWKCGSGIYILTLEKSNSALIKIGEIPVDYDDPRNIGVISDEYAGPSNGVMMRRVTYCDPVTGKQYRFITNLPKKIPPGLIAFLYKMRWDIEKTFDEIKNKIFEQKAWAAGNNAKQQQAHFIALAHNLMRLVEFNLEHEEGITDQVSRKKRKRRIQQDVDKAHAAGRKPNPLVTGLLRCTQRGVQFIRWLTSSLSRLTSWRAAVDELRPLMSNLL